MNRIECDAELPCSEPAFAWIPFWGYACRSHYDRPYMMVGLVAEPGHRCEWGHDRHTTLHFEVRA